jgi:hypothetical protein
MTPEQIAKRFHGECVPDGKWCSTHNSGGWRGRGNTIHCDEMIDYIDLAEQAVEAYQTDLRAEVRVLRNDASNALLHAEGYVEISAAGAGIAVLDDVLDLIDGDSDD